MVDLAIDPRTELNPPLVEGERSLHRITETVSNIVERRTPRAMMYADGMNVMANITHTPIHNSRWRVVNGGRKSTRMTRSPLKGNYQAVDSHTNF